MRGSALRNRLGLSSSGPYLLPTYSAAEWLHKRARKLRTVRLDKRSQRLDTRSPGVGLRLKVSRQRRLSMRPMLASRRIEQALLMNYGCNAVNWLASISAHANPGVNIPGQVVNDLLTHRSCAR